MKVWNIRGRALDGNQVKLNQYLTRILALISSNFVSKQTFTETGSSENDLHRFWFCEKKVIYLHPSESS